jgi:hypothetical protein
MDNRAGTKAGGESLFNQGTAEDRAALHQLVVLYCRAIDRRDFKLLEAVFHEDAHLDYGSGTYRGNLSDWMKRLPRVLDQYKITQHHITNTHFCIDGDQAEGESYLLALHVFKDTARPAFSAAGRYLDQFTKSGGVWRIIRRTALADWDNAPPEIGEPNRGRSTPDDPSYTAIRMYSAASQR